MAEQPNDNYARHDHLHDERYSQISHNHDSVYSKLGHVHDYAASNHNHDTVYSKLGHLHDDKYAPLSHVNDTDAHNGGITVPDYGQTIDIMQFPWTAIASGQIVLSWSIDNRYIVMPCVNGIRICGLSDQTDGAFTTTFSVAKDDVVTIKIITNTNGDTANGPTMLNMDGMGTLQGNNLFILGSYQYVMYARFTPFKNQNISNLAGDVELHLGSHTGVHEAEATGTVTTTDPSKSVTIVKSANQMTMQQTIDDVLVDLTDPATTPPSQSGYVDIGALRIIYGITPVIPRKGSINQIVRIKLPQFVPTLLSVTTTIVMTGNDYNGSQVTLTAGPECTAQVLRVIDDYLYVYVDGHVANINPEIAISYNIFITK